MSSCFVCSVIVLSVCGICLLAAHSSLTVQLKLIGTTTIQVPQPKGFKLTIKDRIKYAERATLHMNISHIRDHKKRIQLHKRLTLLKTEDYYQWEYKNDDLELRPGNALSYYFVITIRDINFTYVSNVYNCTILDDGSLFSPPEQLPAEYAYLDSIRDEHGKLFDIE